MEATPLLWSAGWSLVWALLPVWMLGAVTGYLLPRRPLSSLSSFLLSATSLRHAVLAAQAALIVREVWYKITDPGTFRRFLRAVALLCLGKGWTFDFPSSEQPGAPTAVGHSAPEADNWYVTEKDLAFFLYHGEGTGATQGAGPWEVMMEKEIPNCLKYIAWRRVLPNGKTEYKSKTICPDASAEEFIDLYFDDDFRPQWDTMIIGHSVAEHGDFLQRQQVVRWTRRFPFSFISDRQYTIARRMFKQGGDLFGITKAVEHPSACMDTHVVSVDEFYSMWRSRNVECPWGSGAGAVETLLLHHEQFKIPENLARFAVRHGMWGFVKKMSQTMPKFIAMRRAKGVSSSSRDPNAYGAGFAPNPPLLLRRADTYGSSLYSSGSSNSENSSEYDMPQQRSRSSERKGGASAGRKLRGFAAFAIASGIALLVRRSRGGEGGGNISGGGGKGHGEACSRLSRSASLASGLSHRQHRYRFSAAEPFTE